MQLPAGRGAAARSARPSRCSRTRWARSCKGWRTCSASHNTIDLLLEHFDFEWDASIWNDDLPYMIEGHGKKFMEIPFSAYSDAAYAIQITNPMPPTPFSTWETNTPDFILRIMKAQFDALYERGAEQGRADADDGARLHHRPAVALARCSTSSSPMPSSSKASCSPPTMRSCAWWMRRTIQQ